MRAMTSFAHLPETIRLGDLEVFRLGFGAMQLPGPMVYGPPHDPTAARAVLRRVIDLGINLIDTSWYYGPYVSNELIKQVLHPYKAGLVLATKLGGRRTDDKGWASYLRPEELRKGCEEDLRTLGRDHLDIVHLRWIPHGAAVTFGEAMDAMIALKSEGKIRHLGLSNVTLAQIQEALRKTPIVTVENLYNAAASGEKLGQSFLGNTAGQEEIVAFCTEHGIAYLPYFPLNVPGPSPVERPVIRKIAAARGVSETQVAIAWLLARSPVILPIPGTSTVAHLEDNWAARKLALTRDEIAAITEARSP
jgi:aryl-alcohol dehydrogenase-like predicted oxidoreductase